jgi:hypothetical protein
MPLGKMPLETDWFDADATGLGLPHRQTVTIIKSRI